MKIVRSGLFTSLLTLSASLAGADELAIQPLVPNHVAFTQNKYPSLCWVMTGMPPAGAIMRFTLTDSRLIQPILEIQLPSAFLSEKSAPCHCVNLKDYDIPLEPDTQYRWFISIARSHDSPSLDLVGGGVIERCNPVDCMMERIPTEKCDVRLVITLGQSGLWYDSISCLCDLIKSNPDDKSVRQLLDAFMRNGGLQKLNPS